MKKLIVCSLFLLLMACQKEDPAPAPLPCESENFGQVRITNKLSEAADIFFNDAFQINVKANSTAFVSTVPPGDYTVEAKTDIGTYTRNFQFERCKINDVILE